MTITNSGFHRDFPPGAHEVWDILAKALMLRGEGSVLVTREELLKAKDTQCEVMLTLDGGIVFRVERQ